MRIITGSAKGTKLKTPKGLSTRPTSDRVKESLFNILGFNLSGIQVLDLFAGTGNLGLEALSRGASNAFFVDYDIHSVNLIKENAMLTKLSDRVVVHRAEVLKALDLLALRQETFDLIFCDPPYNTGLANKTFDRLDHLPLLKREGMLVIEHSRHEPLIELGESLKCIRIQRYGETMLSFFVHI